MPVAAVASSSTRAACLSLCRASSASIRQARRVSATAEPRSPIAEKPFDELDLAGVVHVVGCAPVRERVDSVAAARGAFRKSPLRYPRDRLAKPPVLLVQQGEIRAPRSFGRRVGAREPVAPFVGERPALLSGQAAPVGVLPVRDVHRELPDVVAICARTPRGFLDRDAAQRPPQVRAVPGLPPVTLIDDPEKERELGRSLRLHRATRRTSATNSSYRGVVWEPLFAAGVRQPSEGVAATADGTKRSRRRSTNRTAQIAQSEPMSRRFTDFLLGSIRDHVRRGDR